MSRRILRTHPRLVVAWYRDVPGWYVIDAGSHRRVDPHGYSSLHAAYIRREELQRAL